MSVLLHRFMTKKYGSSGCVAAVARVRRFRPEKFFYVMQGELVARLKVESNTHTVRPTVEYSDQPPIRAFSNRVTRCPPHTNDNAKQLTISSTDLTTNKSTQAVGGWETLEIIVTGFASEASICKSVKVQKP